MSHVIRVSPSSCLSPIECPSFTKNDLFSPHLFGMLLKPESPCNNCEQVHEIVDVLQSQAIFEATLSKLSAKFINLVPDVVDGEITNGMSALGNVMGADRVSIAMVEESSGDFVITHSWARPGIPEYPERVLRSVLPWAAARLIAGESILVNTPAELPKEAVDEKQYMESLGVKSSVLVPLRIARNVVGVLSCCSFRNYQRWNEVTISRYQAAADVFANAIFRKQEGAKLQRAYDEIQRLKEQLEIENTYLKEEIKLEHSHHAIIGNSVAIRAVLKKAEQVAGTDSTVLVLGETGTGKELIARAIHEMSGRSKRLMVKTNCAALPATLIESELFGREKGAYTGALAREIGRFEMADQSTIFLDEIGELPPEVQSKLLRVLQEGEFERLGSSRTIKVNVRVIAATSRDLPAMVKEGKFRQDLFYRLNVFPIVVPPLRERIEDIPALVWHIVDELARRMGRKIDGVHSGTVAEFQKHSWPGNVRELRNVIERNLILNTGPIFRAERSESQETEYYRKVLQEKGWRIRGEGGAADTLGLKPTTLEARMKKLGICRP